MTDQGNPWTVRGRKTLYDNAWIRLDEHDVLDASGAARAYSTVSFKKVAVGVLPLFEDGTVALVGQYRFPLSAYSWEMPEGGSEPGEDERETAMRELKEEAGLSAETLTEILRMHLSNSVTDERAVIYLATGLTQGQSSPDDDEVLAAARVPYTEVLARVVSGAITDALTVAAVLRVHHMAATGALAPALCARVLG